MADTSGLGRPVVAAISGPGEQLWQTQVVWADQLYIVRTSFGVTSPLLPCDYQFHCHASRIILLIKGVVTKSEQFVIRRIEYIY